MQLLAKLTKFFQKEPGLVRRFARPAPRDPLDDLVNDLKRELYGMDMREENAVRQILTSTGQWVTICRDTIAFGRKGEPCALERGSQVKIPGIPLQLDADRGVQVVVMDRKNQSLSMRLPDFIRDVCSGHRNGWKAPPRTDFASLSPASDAVRPRAPRK
jgi:hypothetical protein